jgi:hypothetical protein
VATQEQVLPAGCQFATSLGPMATLGMLNGTGGFIALLCCGAGFSQMISRRTLCSPQYARSTHRFLTQCLKTDFGKLPVLTPAAGEPKSDFGGGSESSLGEAACRYTFTPTALWTRSFVRFVTRQNARLRPEHMVVRKTHVIHLRGIGAVAQEALIP